MTSTALRSPLALAVTVPLALLGAARPGPAGDEIWTQEELEKVSDQIRLDIEKVRETPFKRPVAVKVTDKEGFNRYVEHRVELTETPESLASDETIAKLLGLIPAEMDLLAKQKQILESQVGGFYDPGGDIFYLMSTYTGDLARIILAHELTHALDDQLYDIDGTLERLGRTTDAETAFQAVVEGSGMMTMNAWVMGHVKALDPEEIAKADLSQGLEDAPELIWKPLLAAYIQGLGFLNRGHKLDGDEALERAFTDPPRSSEQILHPDKYWDATARDEPRRIELDLTALPEGWEVLAEDTLGELYLGLVTTPIEKRGGLTANPLAVLGVKYTNDASTGWGGDRVVLLGKGDERFLQLVTLWDSPEDAGEFFRAACAWIATPVDAGWHGEVVRHASKEGLDPESGPASVVLDVRLGAGARDLRTIPWREVR